VEGTQYGDGRVERCIALRNRFATRAYRGSGNLRAMQTLLGRSSVATTERYTAVDDDEIRAAMMATLSD
jgi:integrase/recombinase XerC